MSRTPIEGKVAQILNERELVINVGSKNGVTSGMRFAVLADSPTEIRDPDSKEVLGVVDRDKVRVEAREVYERFTVCGTYERVLVGTGAAANTAFWDLVGPRRMIPETLRVATERHPAALASEESFVKIGDRVRSLDA